jgi:hypothetical protein
MPAWWLARISEPEVALVGDGVQVIAAERRFGCRCHRGQLVAVKALVRDILGDDQVGLGVDRDLGVVTDEPAAPGAGRHRPGIRVGQRDLAVRRVRQRLLHGLQALDLLPDAIVPPGEMGHILGARLALLLTVDPRHGVNVARDIGFQMGKAVGDLALGEVAVTVVDRLELAAVDRDAIALQYADAAAEFDELCAGLADGGAVVAPEIGDGLVVRREATRQPHQLDVAPGFALQPPTGGNVVQVAVDEELEQDRRVIAWPPRPRRRRALEPKLGQVQLFDEKIDDADEMILADTVLQSLGKQRRLPSVDAFDEPCHACPCLFRRAYIKVGFSHRLGRLRYQRPAGSVASSCSRSSEESSAR